MTRIKVICKMCYNHVFIIVTISILYSLTGMTLVKTAYAQLCGPECDPTGQEELYCELYLYGSWDDVNCICIGGCDPQAYEGCPQGYFDPLTCTCTYNPCNPPMYSYMIYFYSWFEGICINCFQADGCVYADIIFETYGFNGEFCGYESYSSQTQGCGIQNFLTECLIYAPYCIYCSP